MATTAPSCFRVVLIAAAAAAALAALSVSSPDPDPRLLSFHAIVNGFNLVNA
jgi:hypothetical protein